MSKICADFIEVDDVDSFDYDKTRINVDELFGKYRNYKEKEYIILKRYKSSLSLDNLGIYSNRINNPVLNKIEQAEKYTKFIETIEGIYNLYKDNLTNDEKIVYQKCLVKKCTDEELMTALSLCHSAMFRRKRSCYIKVAKWFDLEVYKNE